MKNKRIGIGDIARELNISITTVSFILNGKTKEKRISNELAKKVMKLAHDVGYVPNRLAQSLITGKTNTISLIVEDISNPFFAHVARLIEGKADKKGYEIFYCSSENDTQKSKNLIRLFRERQVDGYIITPALGIEDEIDSLLKNRASVVLFDRYLQNIDTNYVVIDNYVGAYQAINHLAEHGYKNIAIVTLDSAQTQMQERLNGYKNAIKKNKLRPYIKKIKFKKDKDKIIQEIIPFLSSEESKIDAVFFATNYLGISGLEAIKTLNLKIPSEIGVICFDDHDLFRLYSPAITVVAQPIEEMSETVINILLNQMDNENLENKRITLPTSLIIRQSSKSEIS